METRLAQPLAPMPDWAALTIAGCVLVFMDTMLFVILSPYRIVAGRPRSPSSANKMIRARNTSRCSVVGARTRASSTARSASISPTSAPLRSQ